MHSKVKVQIKEKFKLVHMILPIIISLAQNSHLKINVLLFYRQFISEILVSNQNTSIYIVEMK